MSWHQGEEGIRLVAAIHQREPELAGMSTERLARYVVWLASRLERGETSARVLPDAFAVFRESSKRGLGFRPTDQQMLAAAALHRGSWVGAPVSEGPLLAMALAGFLHALSGTRVHLLTGTPNEAQSFFKELGPLFQILGRRLGCGIASIPGEEPEPDLWVLTPAAAAGFLAQAASGGPPRVALVSVDGLEALPGPWSEYTLFVGLGSAPGALDKWVQLVGGDSVRVLAGSAVRPLDQDVLCSQRNERDALLGAHWTAAKEAGYRVLVAHGGYETNLSEVFGSADWLEWTQEQGSLRDALAQRPSGSLLGWDGNKAALPPVVGPVSGIVPKAQEKAMRCVVLVTYRDATGSWDPTSWILDSSGLNVVAIYRVCALEGPWAEAFGLDQLFSGLWKPGEPVLKPAICAARLDWALTLLGQKLANASSESGTVPAKAKKCPLEHGIHRWLPESLGLRLLRLLWRVLKR